MKVTGVTHFLVSSGQAKNFIFVLFESIPTKASPAGARPTPKPTGNRP